MVLSLFSDFYSDKLDGYCRLDCSNFDLEIISAYLDCIYFADIAFVEKLDYVRKLKMLEFLHYEGKTLDEGRVFDNYEIKPLEFFIFILDFKTHVESLKSS